MARKSYVWLQGELREKAGDNSVLINGQKWTQFGGQWAPEGEHGSAAPMVMPDIAPYRSTITGELINSRSTHRTHLRDHGCIEVGNEKPKPRQETWTASKGLRQELIARLNS